MLQHSTDIESFDDLPNRSKIPKDSRRGYRGRAWRSTYPHNKVLRFLESRVGKLWNDVYSEFCHLTWLPEGHKNREKLSWNVMFETTMKDGKLHYIEEGSGDIKPLDQYWRRISFYIHPVTQKLCRYTDKKKVEIKRPETFRIIGDYHQFVKIKGIWHEVKGEPIKSDIVEIDGLHYRKVKTLSTPEILPTTQKFFGRKVVIEEPKYKKTADGYYLIPTANAPRYSYYSGDRPLGPQERLVADDDDANLDNRLTHYYRRSNHVKITMNRQLSSKELKKHGLKNEPEVLFLKPCPICGNVSKTNYVCQANHREKL